MTSEAAPSPSPALSSQSTETLDVGMDRDLEKALSAPASPDAATTPAIQPSTSEKPVDPREAAVGPGGVRTLGHADPENPRNWGLGKRIWQTAVLCIWTLSLTYDSTAYVSSLRAIVEKFDISQEVAILGVTLFVLGFAAGPLLFAPASEVFGRRAVYAFCGLIYSAFSWGAAFPNNAATLLISRFIMAFFGSAAINNTPASLGDFTTPANRNLFSIFYAICAFGGPSLGPLCGGFIETYAGMAWNFRVMAIFSTTFSILAALLPETHGPTLLKWREQKEGKNTEKITAGKLANVFKVALARPVIFLFTEPVVMLVSLYLAVLYAILYGFFAAFTVVWLEIRGWSATDFALTYVALGIGFLLGMVSVGIFSQKAYNSRAAAHAALGQKTPPEARLVLARYAGPVVPVALFIFAWTAPFPHVHWIAPLIAEAMFGGAMLACFTCYIPYLIDAYMMYAASALAAGMAARALLGSVFPLFTIQMYHALTVQGATSLLAGITIILTPLPFVFDKYATRLRAASKYAVHDD